MPEELQFETVMEKTIDFGANNFLELSRNKVHSARGETEFISLKRGFYAINSDGDPEKRYRKNKSITIPDTEEVKAFIVENLKTI